MDHYGIGIAMSAMALNFDLQARRTGRTTSLVESVKDGDRVVFLDRKEAERVRRLCLDRGVTIEVVVAGTNEPDRLFGRGTTQGRTILDHSWVQRFYSEAIAEARHKIDHIERETSGYGEAHRETRRHAEERMKWR